MYETQCPVCCKLARTDDEKRHGVEADSEVIACECCGRFTIAEEARTQLQYFRSATKQGKSVLVTALHFEFVGR